MVIDENKELSYTLAHVLVRNISQDYSAFVNFSNHANYEDSGESAAQEYLGLLLKQIVGSFLGEGNWQPECRFNEAPQSTAKSVTQFSAQLYASFVNG